MGTVENDLARLAAREMRDAEDAAAFNEWCTGDKVEVAVAKLFDAGLLDLNTLFAVTVKSVCSCDQTLAGTEAARDDDYTSTDEAPAAAVLAWLQSWWESEKQMARQDAADDAAMMRAWEDA